MTLTDFVVGDTQLDVTPVGTVRDTDCAWPFVDPLNNTGHDDAACATCAVARPAATRQPTATARRAVAVGRCCIVVEGQLVQASVAGLVVAVAAPPDAVIPVNDGREK